MKMKIIPAVFAATSLLATPVLAQSALAERVPAPVEDSEELGDDSTLLLALLAAAAIIAGIILLSDDDDASGDLPTSP